MNDQLVFGEEETITLNLPWSLDNCLLLLWGQFWQVIDELPRILRIGDNEAKLEFIGPNDFSAEIMSLDHLHLLNWLGPNSEIESQPNCGQLQKVWPKVILDDAGAGVIVLNWVGILLLRHINESDF